MEFYLTVGGCCTSHRCSLGLTSGRGHRKCAEGKLEESDTHWSAVRKGKNATWLPGVVIILTGQRCELKCRPTDNLCGVDLDTMIFVDGSPLCSFRMNMKYEYICELNLSPLLQLRLAYIKDKCRTQSHWASKSKMEVTNLGLVLQFGLRCFLTSYTSMLIQSELK